MKKILFLLIVFFISTSSYSQIVGEDEVYLSGDLIDARFQDGGIENFHNYVIQNFDIKTVEKAGQILYEFTINEKGEVKNIKILRDLGTNSAVELIRVLRGAPKWQPASRGGKAISITLKMPLNFK